MSDIELIQKYFKVNAEEALSLLDKGLNVDYLRNGYKDFLQNEVNKVGERYQSKVDDLVEKELASGD